MESITNDVVIHKKIISNQKKNINDIKLKIKYHND